MSITSSSISKKIAGHQRRIKEKRLSIKERLSVLVLMIYEASLFMVTNFVNSFIDEHKHLLGV